MGHGTRLDGTTRRHNGTPKSPASKTRRLSPAALTVAELFSRYGDTFRSQAGTALSMPQHRVMMAIEQLSHRRPRRCVARLLTARY